MFRKDRRPEPDRIELTVGSGVTLRGDIRCEGSIRIDGIVEDGSIETLGNIVIGPKAKVLADIQADGVSVAGTYKGELRARRLELLDGGSMWGTLRVESFLLDDGGFLHGELIMVTEDAPEEPFSVKPAQGRDKPPVAISREVDEEGNQVAPQEDSGD